MTLNFYLATKNTNKVKEVREILKSTGVRALLPVGDIVYPEEDGSTFHENALIKAAHLRKSIGKGLFAGEDSGLMVKRLNNLPGINSARFAGIHGDSNKNIKKLLEMMAPYKNPLEREAAFITVISLLGDGEEEFFEGTIKGIITLKPRGNNGFGYDPVFEIPGAGKTFAELSEKEKNRISHRSIAFKKMADYLVEKYSKKV